MGTGFGNIMGILFFVIISVTGFISIQFAAITFAVVSYGFWALLYLINFRLGRLVIPEFKSQLSADELRVFREYNIHIRASGFGEAVSSFLNFFRFAEFVWVGLCIWQELYVLSAVIAGFYFVSGGLILRTNPILYMSTAARNGEKFAIHELQLLQSVCSSRDRFLQEDAELNKN